jgi:hypothetical protein
MEKDSEKNYYQQVSDVKNFFSEARTILEKRE